MTSGRTWPPHGQDLDAGPRRKLTLITGTLRPGQLTRTRSTGYRWPNSTERPWPRTRPARWRPDHEAIRPGPRAGSRGQAGSGAKAGKWLDAHNAEREARAAARAAQASGGGLSTGARESSTSRVRRSARARRSGPLRQAAKAPTGRATMALAGLRRPTAGTTGPTCEHGLRNYHVANSAVGIGIHLINHAEPTAPAASGNERASIHNSRPRLTGMDGRRPRTGSRGHSPVGCGPARPGPNPARRLPGA